MTSIDFIKMQGAGNDFVVLDRRGSDAPALTAVEARALSDRHFGIGCDLICEIRKDPSHDAELTFLNSDGSPAAACGNATRCVTYLMAQETGRTAFEFRTGYGSLRAEVVGNGLYAVNMGPPELRWDHIPLAKAVDLNALPIDGAPGAAGMGNPHMVFRVDDAESVDLPGVGPALEHHPLYPERTNVEFCSIREDGSVRMRVWERGVGVTLACGSGACAALVVLARQGHVGKTADLVLDGGTLTIDWRDDGVWMTGPAQEVFRGQCDLDAL